MDTARVELAAPGFDRPGTVMRYGHWGRPVLVFPCEAGRAWDFADRGMLESSWEETVARVAAAALTVIEQVAKGAQ